MTEIGVAPDVLWNNLFLDSGEITSSSIKTQSKDRLGVARAVSLTTNGFSATDQVVKREYVLRHHDAKETAFLQSKLPSVSKRAYVAGDTIYLARN